MFSWLSLALQDGKLLGNTPAADGGGGVHNCHFTLESRTEFTYTNAAMAFTFASSDDLFVFVSGQRVVNLGGVHELETATFRVADMPSIQLGDTFQVIDWAGRIDFRGITSEAQRMHECSMGG